ncbi:MAG: RecBCD enzyme subunit RecC [Candidatus Anoxychlamydiales bacterium]|nr:RecBCD enzyme subunit RecC [Candidatus Anoxychlamydiales bacterium]
MKATFSSNFLEILVEQLKENLFFNSSISKSYVFVENQFAKNYLMQNFCDDPELKVAFDINFVSISNFINIFQNELKTPKEKRFLNFLELNLIIRQKILKHIKSMNSSCIDSPYIDLYKYLIKDEKIDKRVNLLTFELTKLFLQYSIFLTSKKVNETKDKYWQMLLFYEIFYKDGYRVAFRDLHNLDIEKFQNCNFHFFAINYISPLYFDFISRLNNVNHYFLSPSMNFFEDIVSDFERQKLLKVLKNKKTSLKKLENLDEYLKDRNVFLANMERLKRFYLKTMNSYDDYITFDKYLSYDDIEEKSFLQNFQLDILNLENLNSKKTTKNDDSIQIHIANSKLRETQILHSNILKLLQNENINLSDIHIIAPNIDEYAAYIQMVFSDPQNPLYFKISDLKVSNKSFFISGLKKLISFANSRWEKEDIIEIFQNPLFQKRHNFSKEEIKLLFNWIERANISWGLDEEHILRFIKKDDTALIKSLEKGFSRILLAAIFLTNLDLMDLDPIKENANERENSTIALDIPIEEIEISDLNILEKFLKTLNAIYDDIQIIENKKELSLKEWKKFLASFSSNHFEQDFFDNVIARDQIFYEKAAITSFNSFLHDLNNLDFRFDNENFSFDIIYEHFVKHVDRCKTDINPHLINALHFSSFEMSYLPAKAVFIIGLEEEAFSLSVKSSIDSIRLNIPTASDRIRSNFLQALLSSRNFLILSYSSKENSKMDASILLQELLSYLDSSYTILNQKPSKYLVKKHASYPFHKNYFAEKNLDLSNVFYKAAKAYYEEDKLKHDFFDKIEEKQTQNDFEEVIDLQNLRYLCKNPIGFYFKSSLEIYLQEEEVKSDFMLSSLDKYIIKQDFLKHNLDIIFQVFEKKAKMPIGVFNAIAKDKIRGDILKFYENLKTLKVDIQTLKSVRFDLKSSAFEKIDDLNFKMPPIEIETKKGLVKIIGMVNKISNQGILSDFDTKMYNLVRFWPDILAYQKLDDSFVKNIVFTKSAKVKSIKIDRVDECFIKLIDYYQSSKNQISFMIKPFCESILLKDEKKLSKAIETILTPVKHLDAYSKWFFTNFKKPRAIDIIESSKIFLKDVFSPLEEIHENI